MRAGRTAVDDVWNTQEAPPDVKSNHPEAMLAFTPGGPGRGRGGRGEQALEAIRGGGFPRERPASRRTRPLPEGTDARGGGCLEPILREACSQAYPVSAICVQRFDDSLSSAIRITYRISLRSSSLREPRYPLLRVV